MSVAMSKSILTVPKEAVFYKKLIEKQQRFHNDTMKKAFETIETLGKQARTWEFENEKLGELKNRTDYLQESEKNKILQSYGIEHSDLNEPQRLGKEIASHLFAKRLDTYMTYYKLRHKILPKLVDSHIQLITRLEKDSESPLDDRTLKTIQRLGFDLNPIKEKANKVFNETLKELQEKKLEVQTILDKTEKEKNQIKETIEKIAILAEKSWSWSYTGYKYARLEEAINQQINNN